MSQQYLYQAITVTPGVTYLISWDYSSDGDVGANTPVYLGFSELTDIESQTVVASLSNANYQTETVNANESQTRTDSVTPAAGQTQFFISVEPGGTGNITFDNVSVKVMGGNDEEVGDRFDFISLRRGEINNIYYYSRYGWQDQSGNYKENSTVDGDFINCTTDEYNLILLKCTEFAAEEVDEEANQVRSIRGALVFNPRYEKFNRLKKDYEKNHPSEALIMINTVATFIKV